MTAEELVKKFNDFSTDLATSKVANEEIAKELKEMGDKVATAISLKEKSEEQSKLIENHAQELKAMNERLAGMKSKREEKIRKDFRSALDVALKDYGVDKFIEKMKGSSMSSIEMEVKAISIGGITGREVYFTDRDSELGVRPYAPMSISNLIPTRNVSGKFWHWLDKIDVNNAGGTAEGAVKNPANQALEEKNVEIFKYTVKEDYTMEFEEDDVDNFMNELVNTLPMDVMEAIEEDLIDGDGASDNMVGLKDPAYSTPFTAGGFAGTVPNANIGDLVSIIRAQIEAAKHVPNAVVMNPLDVVKYRLSKDADGQYVWPMLMMSDGRRIDDLPIISTPYITANTLMVGDFRRPRKLMRKGVVLKFSYDNNDNFEKNIVTYLAESRASIVNKTNDITALGYVSDIDAALAVLETP